MYPKSCLWHDYLVSYLRLAAVVSFLNSNICFSFLDLLRPLTSYCTNFLVTGFLSWFEFAHLWPCCCCSSCCFTEYTGFESSVPCCCSVAQKCLPLCDPMDCSTPSFPVLHHLPEFAQTHVHWVDGAIPPSHPLPPSSLFAFNLSKNRKILRDSGESNQKHYRYPEISQEFSTSFSFYCEWLLFHSPPFESTYPFGSHKM